MSSTTVTGVGPARGTIRNGVGGSKVSGSDMVPQASHHVDSSSRLRLQGMFVGLVEHRDEGRPPEVEFAVRRTRHERHGTSDPRERLIGLNGSNTIGVGASRSHIRVYSAMEIPYRHSGRSSQSTNVVDLAAPSENIMPKQPPSKRHCGQREPLSSLAVFTISTASVGEQNSSRRAATVGHHCCTETHQPFPPQYGLGQPHSHDTGPWV